MAVKFLSDGHFSGSSTDLTLDGQLFLPSYTSSPAAPTISFDSNAGGIWYDSNDDQIWFRAGNSNRAYINSSGVVSQANVYTGTNNEFRNYAGVWKATTGQTGNGFQFINSVDGTALTLSSTGNAVFTGNVTAVDITGDNILSTANSGDPSIYINSTRPTLGFTDSNSFTDSNDIYIIRGTSGNALQFQWYDDSAGTYTQTFSIGNTGNASFAGSVTAGSFVKSGGTSSQFLMADGSVSTGGSGISQADADVRYVRRTGGTSSAMSGDLHIISGGPKIYLQDNTDDDDQAIIFRNNGGSDEYKIATQDFTSGGGADGFYIGSTTSDGEIGLVTANTTALTIDTSQRVGIGTAPNEKLHVDGTTRFNGDVHIGGSASGFVYRPVESNSAVDRYFLMFDYTNNASYPFLTNRTPNGAVVIKTGTAAGSGENEHFRIKGGDGIVDAYFTNTRLGIGTPTPGYILDVGGTSRIAGTIHMYGAVRNYSGNFSLQNGVQDADIFFKVNDGGTTTTAMTVKGSNSFIGIGTASPLEKLHVMYADTAGISTVYSKGLIEDTDAQLDLLSTSSGTWGSAINFVESAGSNANTDVWSIARKTTGGSGDSSLNFNFGTNNQHDNTNRISFSSTGDLTVQGGDIILGGTGRIQGIDTVSAGTDAANKTYVDNAVSGFVDGSGTANDVAMWSDSDTLTDAPIAISGNNATFAGQVTATQLNLENMGNYITFYGNNDAHHSITSRQLDGGTGDDIRVNTYGSFIVNLDSNNNQTSAANSSFFIGRHGGNASSIGSSDQIFTVDGQTGNVEMQSGHAIGKFAVMSTAPHGSYDFYNNGTSYFNGGVIVDDHLQVTGGSAQLTVAGSVNMNQSNTQVTMSGNTSGNFTLDNNTGSIAFQANGSTVNSMTITSSAITLNENTTATGTFDPQGNILGAVIDDGNTANPLQVRRSAATTMQVGINFTVSPSSGSGFSRYLGVDSSADLRFGSSTNHATNALVLTTANYTSQFSSFAGDIVPSADSTYDLGSNAKKWAEGHFDHLYIGETGNNPRIDIYTESSNNPIADTFAQDTQKSYIYFNAGSGSNDPGYIMHETTGDPEGNEGVLHLVPSDDNASTDYVSIHGTNDPDAIKLYTNGLIETANYQLVLRSAVGDVYIDDGLTVNGTIAATGGTSTTWNEAHDNMIISASVSGTSTKTLTLNQNDGGTITASWTDLQGTTVSAPNAPTNLSLSIVNNTINVTFNASSTSGIDQYLVFGSANGGDYSLISVIEPASMGSTMSVIDDSFDDSGAQAYRVYAMKTGVMSSALSGSITYTVSTPVEPTNMSVVNLNTAFYIQWDPPSSNARFVTAYNVYKHEHATQGSLSRSSATLIYSGMNTSYMYEISGNNNLNYHQFWVETTVT